MFVSAVDNLLTCNLKSLLCHEDAMAMGLLMEVVDSTSGKAGRFTVYSAFIHVQPLKCFLSLRKFHDSVTSMAATSTRTSWWCWKQKISAYYCSCYGGKKKTTPHDWRRGKKIIIIDSEIGFTRKWCNDPWLITINYISNFIWMALKMMHIRLHIWLHMSTFFSPLTVILLTWIWVNWL